MIIYTYVFQLCQPDQVNEFDSWPGGPKVYLRQPVISPVIQQTKMEEPLTAVLTLLNLIEPHQGGVYTDGNL